MKVLLITAFSIQKIETLGKIYVSIISLLLKIVSFKIFPIIYRWNEDKWIIYKLLIVGRTWKTFGENKVHLTFAHLKKSHLASGSSDRPSPLRQTKNSRPRLGPFFVTFLLRDSSLCFKQRGLGGGGLNIFPHAALVSPFLASI